MKSRLEAAAVFVAGFVVVLLGTGRPLNFFDEAWMLVGAERIRAGELPYRDFYALYPPGQYFTSAGLFTVFGSQAMTLRLYSVAVRAAVALVLYLVVRRLAGRALALAVWAAVVTWLLAIGFYAYPVFPALLLVLIALVMLDSLTEDDGRDHARSRRRLAAAGAAVGVSALFRHDIGAYGLVACAPLWLSLRRTHERPALPFLAGLILAFGVPAALVVAYAPADRLVFELFTYPSQSYQAMRGRPYPPLLAGPLDLTNPRRLGASLANLSFYVPVVLGVAALTVAAVRRRRSDALLAGVALLCLAAMNLARVRADTIQVCAAVLLSFVVTAAIVRSLWDGGGAARRGLALASIAVSSLLLIWPAHALKTLPLGLPSLAPDDPCRASFLAAGSARREAAGYLRSVVPPGGRVFVACGRHDKVFVNEPILYFLADRLPGVRHHSFDPGVITTRPVQEEVVRDLVRHRVEYVAVSTEFDDWQEPNRSAVPSGVTVLDDYLRANYAEDRRFNAVLSVWRRTTAWETR